MFINETILRILNDKGYSPQSIKTVDFNIKRVFTGIGWTTCHLLRFREVKTIIDYITENIPESQRRSYAYICYIITNKAEARFIPEKIKKQYESFYKNQVYVPGERPPPVPMEKYIEVMNGVKDPITKVLFHLYNGDIPLVNPSFWLNTSFIRGKGRNYWNLDTSILYATTGVFYKKRYSLPMNRETTDLAIDISDVPDLFQGLTNNDLHRMFADEFKKHGIQTTLGYWIADNKDKNPYPPIS